MKITFAEPLGMCECSLEAKVKTLKDAGHSVSFYPDRNEDEEIGRAHV